MHGRGIVVAGARSRDDKPSGARAIGAHGADRRHRGQLVPVEQPAERAGARRRDAADRAAQTAFANPLQVELANSDGCPITTAVTGTVVTFTAPASGPSATFAASGSNTLTVGTDATGSASVQMLTANDTPGAYTVTASSAYGSVSFSLTNTAAGIPATITPLAPTSQHAPSTAATRSRCSARARRQRQPRRRRERDVQPRLAR